MGGLWKKQPFTVATFACGTLALMGVYGFSGFYSKDSILIAASEHTPAIYYCGLFAAFLTAFYSWRLILLTFHGEPRADHHTMEHVHESPWVMLIPLLVLATGAIVTGVVFAPLFIGEHEQGFWRGAIVNGPHNHVLHAMHEVPAWVPVLPTIIGASGIALAFLM